MERVRAASVESRVAEHRFVHLEVTPQSESEVPYPAQGDVHDEIDVIRCSRFAIQTAGETPFHEVLRPNRLEGLCDS